MKKNKIIIIIILIIIIISIIFFTLNNFSKKSKNKNEDYQNYIPEEEISEKQARQTIITLYFINSETGEVVPEARLIDAVTLINNPYEELLNLLIQGPKNEKLNKIIPDGTKINSVTKEGECLIIDFSEEFLNSLQSDESKNNTINTIVNTLTELNEINCVKFLINGNQNENLNESYVRIK